jgi:hypothetical protein
MGKLRRRSSPLGSVSWRWDQSAGKCIKPSGAKADCEARGHQYDIDTGRYIKSLKPKAEEQSGSDDDYRPKKNKKKKKQHDDEDGDRYS